MARYTVYNRASGHNFGIYEAASPSEALDAVARDAGYRDAADALAQIGQTEQDLVADLAE